MLKRFCLAMAALVTMLALLSACASSVDASKARSQAVIQSGGIVPAEDLRVAEYLGSYQQSFPAPVDSALGLDLRLGNMQLPTDGGLVWLQVGVQARTADSDVVAPLNLAIVIDRSGSMDSPEKMPYLKASLRLFLQSLAPDDIVALVAFADSAEVVKPATRVGDGSWIGAAVDRLQPGGGTNLQIGMLAGFMEVDRNFDVRRNNRVILLTDGVANQGVTDPDQIAAAARQYNDKGIYLSTIGLGQSEYNDALLIKLANQGKGAYHFVDSAAEMDKIFRREVTGLLQKAAAGVTATIILEPGVALEALTGYDGLPPAGPVQVQLRDMGTGDSQVLLAQLKVGPGQSGRRPVATVELRYQDLFSTRDASARQTIYADSSRLASYDPTWDTEVLRNVTVQRTAEGIKEIDRLYRAQRYLDAWQLAYRLEQDIRAVARLTNDQQMVKDADTMRRYQDTLARWVQTQTGRLPQAPEVRPAAQPARGRDVSPTSSIPAIEIK